MDSSKGSWKMPKFSGTSMAKLQTAHEDLQKVFLEVVKYFDCSVLEGHRTKEMQDKCCAEGKSKLTWPNSKHNSVPSRAVDVVPYPVDWQDRERFCIFAGFVLGMAAQLGVKLRWGGDWNSNGKTKDESFIDMPHFELIGD